MPFTVKRYAGIKGKTVEYVGTTNEQGFIYVHILFSDKTEISISLTSEVILHSAALYNVTTGDQEVLREYVRPDRPR